MTGEGSTTWLGRLIANRYRLIARLGDGFMADVYLARHVLIDRLSAIKVLRPDVGRDRGMRAVFLREAKAVNRINHPNIVEITDYGETDETAYLVMEYVPGEPLSRHLGHGPFSWVRATRIGLQIALALSRAHEMGVVHRDLKPANVMLVPRRTGDDLVKLTDFGVAKLMSASGKSGGAATGFLPAYLSPGYVAPELAQLGTMDARSDLFSLGVILYESICGALPYAPERPAGTGADYRKLSELLPDVPRDLDELLGRLLAPEPNERPRDAFEVVANLRKILDDAYEPPAPEDVEPPTVRKRAHHHRSGPRLLTMPFDRIGPLCERAWSTVYAVVGKEIRPGLADDLRSATNLFGMMTRLSTVVADDMRALGEQEEEGRRVHAAQGARLDELALERSKALGWAGSFAERGELIRSQRLSGRHSVSDVDALLWEEATLDRVEERTRDRAGDLADMIRGLVDEQASTNDELEHRTSTLEAKLEGHVAAYRALAGEFWMLLETLADSFNLRLPSD